MPKQIKYTKEMILSTGIEMIRESGIEIISARNIAKRLNSSSQPLFSYFSNMDDLKNELRKEADKLYSRYIEEGLKENIPFKAAGIKFIQFAKEEPQLFKFLFLQKNDDNLVSLNYLPNTDSNADAILETVMKEYGLSKEDAKKLYNHLTIYTFGIASLLANGSISFDLKEINILLSDMFLSLIKNYKSNK